MSNSIKCPNCGKIFLVPNQEYIVCPGCGRKYKNNLSFPSKTTVVNNNEQLSEKSENKAPQLALSGPSAPMTETQKGEILRRFAIYLPKDETQNILNLLKNTKQYMYPVCMTLQPKHPWITLLLSIYGGFLGLDRFYIGDKGLGVCKLLFGMLTFGLWPMIDIFVSYRTCKKKNLESLKRLINS